MKTVFAWVAAALCAFAAPALADDEYQQGAPAEASTTDVTVRIGIGGIVQPDWEGSDEYQVVPWPIVTLEYLNIPGVGTIGERQYGWSIGPSFNFIGERDQFSDPALIGLGNVDSVVEVGVRATYELEFWGAFAALRYGFGGYEGIAGEAALYAIWRPTDRFVLRAGPSVAYAGSEYFDTYFSVTPTQSFFSGLPVYDAGSGIRNVGLQGNAIYTLTEKIDLHFQAGYERIVGSAADSPIIAAGGSKDQFSAGIGISYKIDLDLFR